MQQLYCIMLAPESEQSKQATDLNTPLAKGLSKTFLLKNKQTNNQENNSQGSADFLSYSKGEQKCLQKDVVQKVKHCLLQMTNELFRFLRLSDRDYGSWPDQKGHEAVIYS